MALSIVTQHLFDSYLALLMLKQMLKVAFYLFLTFTFCFIKYVCSRLVLVKQVVKYLPWHKLKHFQLATENCRRLLPIVALPKSHYGHKYHPLVEVLQFKQVVRTKNGL